MEYTRDIEIYNIDIKIKNMADLVSNQIHNSLMSIKNRSIEYINDIIEREKNIFEKIILVVCMLSFIYIFNIFSKIG